MSLLVQSSRDGRQRPASAGSLKRLASAPGLVLTSPTRQTGGVGGPSERRTGPSHGAAIDFSDSAGMDFPLGTGSPASVDLRVSSPALILPRGSAGVVSESSCGVGAISGSSSGSSGHSHGLSKPPSARRVQVGGTPPGPSEIPTPRGTATLGIAFSSVGGTDGATGISSLPQHF